MSYLLKERLLDLRASNRLSQRQLAEMLGLPRGTYTHYELGRRTPDLLTLMKIADYYRISLDYLTGYTDRAPSLQEWLADHPGKISTGQAYPLADQKDLLIADDKINENE